MIILAWNTRGLGSKCKRREVRNVVRRYKCNYLILCETKLDSLTSSLTQSIGGRLNYWEFLPSQGASGGIILGWDDSLSDKIGIYHGTFSLSIQFKSHLDGFEWWLSGIYGPCSSSLRGDFFSELSHLQSVMGTN